MRRVGGEAGGMRWAGRKMWGVSGAARPGARGGQGAAVDDGMSVDTVQISGPMISTSVIENRPTSEARTVFVVSASPCSRTV